MTKRILNITVSVIVAVMFLWLAFRSVPFAELWTLVKTASLWWLVPFAFVMILSHYIRAERWRLLFPADWHLRKSTLFAGVMLGYFLNNLVPRLGEISRPVYVARRHGLSKSNMIGTIVLERIIDIISMLFILLFTIFFIIRDADLILRIFGTQDWQWFHYAIVPAFVLFITGGILLFYRILVLFEKKNELKNPYLVKIITITRSFGAGIVSVRNIKHWPGFILFTAFIWLSYILMTYLPFYMFDLTAEYNLTFASAVVITVIASIGITVPTPGGLGSYHLFVQQALWIIYGVPLVTGLAYATVTHAVMMILIFSTTPVSLWWDKFYTLRNKK
ncbi:MAG: lysylphosphatidylglycerol synthase transmembrane domain-containing protein [Balneolaceae bacterium]